ncbi:MAG: guanylate kinase [Actinobacteria bacterium]|nr:guanylate kinase [Actinomycetota bacterium]
MNNSFNNSDLNQKNAIKKGTLFVISGPSGAGKSSLIKEAMSKLDNFVKSVSVTTRPARSGEVQDKNYHFLSESEFKKMQENNQLLEWAEYCGYYYGTPLKFVEDNLNKGINVILEIEVTGAMKIKKIMPDAYLIFITVSNSFELEKRLRERATEKEEVILKRINKAKEEMKYEKYYDCIIINNNYNEALKNLLYVLNSKSGGN